jgi:hypothetical protein
VLDLLVIVLLCVIYAKATRAVAAYQDRGQRWREADADQRERIVHEECAWRVIGRFVAAGGLAIGAFTVASAGLAVMWALVAWRIVKNIKTEMREACSYRSTGSRDEPPYSW